MTLMIPNGLTNCFPTERFPLTIQLFAYITSTLISLQNLPWAPYFVFLGIIALAYVCLSICLSRTGHTVASYFVFSCFTSIIPSNIE